MELKLNYINEIESHVGLLIVPYGIETIVVMVSTLIRKYLLIVPYGIETIHSMISFTVRYTFNCTLWN